MNLNKPMMKHKTIKSIRKNCRQYYDVGDVEDVLYKYETHMRLMADLMKELKHFSSPYVASFVNGKELLKKIDKSIKKATE